MSQVIRFEKIVPEGKAMGHLKDGRAVFCIGPLPDEGARVGIRKQRRTYAEAVLREIMEPSDHRTHEIDDHTMSTAPWQGVAYDYQLQLKREMLQEAFKQHRVDCDGIKMVASKEPLGYRNRLDFTLATIEGRLQLAFHRRGAWDALIPIQGSNLGSDRMNAAALDLVRQLNDLKIEVEPAIITVRHARTTGQLLAILTTAAKADWKRIDATKLGNFIVARPLPGSGAPGEVVYQSGGIFITEQLHHTAITYPYNAFFQTNTAGFEQALDRIITAAADSQRIVELYSGVGAIGLLLAASGTIVHGVEIVPVAVEFAERNARSNKISTYTAEAIAAEHMDASVLNDADCVILDPPRAGLHPRIIKWLLESRPQRLIYLACNPVTQARDIALIGEAYQLHSLTGFDFYPGTLHLESLACLSRLERPRK